MVYVQAHTCAWFRSRRRAHRDAAAAALSPGLSPTRNSTRSKSHSTTPRPSASLLPRDAGREGRRRLAHPRSLLGRPGTPERARRQLIDSDQLTSCGCGCSTAASTRWPRCCPAYERRFRRHTRRDTAGASLFVERAVGAGCVLPVRRSPVRPDVMAGVAVGIAFQVVLVFRFRFPEWSSCGDLRDHLARPQAGGVDISDGLLGDPLLVVAGVEDGRPIACSKVIALAVLRRRIVNLEEELEQIPVRDLLGIEDDLDRLGVRSVVAIGCVRHVATAIANAGRDHTGSFANQVLHSPEAPTGEYRSVSYSGRHRLAPSFGCSTQHPAGTEAFPAAHRAGPE